MAEEKKTDDKGTPGDKTTVLENGGKPPGTPFEQIPEKYRVTKADKSPDMDASVVKLVGGYGELNAKLIAQGLPPASPEEYKVEGDFPGGLNFDELKKQPSIAAGLKRFHSKGMSNAMVKEVLTFFVEEAIADNVADEKTCEKTLRTDHWKTEAEYVTNAKAAFRAAGAYAQKLGTTKEALFKAYGNDPLINRLFAMLGADMKEDVGLGGDAGGGEIASTIEAIDARVADIMTELGTLKSHDPKRKALMDEKRKLFEKKTALGKAKAA